MIVIKNLSFSYNGHNKVLKNINLEIKPGKILALLGPNGSGKTTLLKCIFGSLKPTNGSIYIDGKESNLLSPQELARCVGGVPQEHHPAFPYRVIDVVVMGRTPYLDLFSAPSSLDYKKAEKVLKELGIFHLAYKPYTQLSGGERKIVLIARALVQDPKVLLLDEPTAHLDVKNKIKILTLIRELTKKRRTLAVIRTLHDPNEALLFSDEIALLEKGSIVYLGPSNEIDEKLLEKVYGIPFKIIEDNGTKIVRPIVTSLGDCQDNKSR